MSDDELRQLANDFLLWIGNYQYLQKQLIERDAEIARLRKVEAAGVEVLHEWDNTAFTVTSTRKAVEKLRAALASKPEETP